MSRVRFGLAMSLDGFCAGPDQCLEHPLGHGGLALHDWAFPTAAFRKMQGEAGGEVNASSRVIEESFMNVGAYIMGRNMFGPVRGAWTEPAWNGWWGDNPPYHAPVFVLTHHARSPVTMQGGTTFHFVTDGIASALERARAAAGGKDVVLGGGASTIQQYLAADLVDEVNVSITPVLLGRGERLFDRMPLGVRLEQLRAVEAPGVTHIRYRVVHHTPVKKP